MHVRHLVCTMGTYPVINEDSTTNFVKTGSGRFTAFTTSTKLRNFFKTLKTLEKNVLEIQVLV